MRSLARGLALVAGLAAISSVSSAYYHWIYYLPGSATPIPAKFDLSSLTNKTVNYFISEQGPSPMVAGDSFNAVISEIRAAADAWDSISTSDLRLKFGGIASGATQSAPGIDVVFDDDMTPGLLAQTIVSRWEDQGFAASLNFVPILRSKLQLRRDLAAAKQASWSDLFFTTLVHEFGHTLGLQHSLTSGAMATSVTRATTKSKPLAADDIAGVSALYPVADFAAATGSIAGKVISPGGGVNMASVVAVSTTTGAAVSALSNPDGTYRIDGLPPGSYTVYVHPLPRPLVQRGENTPANIIAPTDFKNTFGANTNFVAQIFPGTRDVAQAFPIPVTARNTMDNVNFTVQPRSGGTPLASMETYGFQGPNQQLAVPTPSLPGGRRAYLAFAAEGAIVNGNLAPGLSVRTLGGPALVEPNSVQVRSGFVYSIISPSPVTTATPVALVVTTDNDLYVLPSAFTVVPSDAPVISGVEGTTDASGNATVRISGQNLGGDIRVMFDGAPARRLSGNLDGSINVAAPPASGNHKAAVVALSADGQTSTQQLGTANPPVFSYSAPEIAGLAMNPTLITAGTDVAIEITGFSSNFKDGLAAVGFGTSDIVVRRSWVVDATHMLATISISPNATPGPTTVTVANGLQMASLKTFLQILPPAARAMSLRAPVLNFATGLAGVPVGGTAVIGTQGLPETLNGWTMTIRDIPALFQKSGNVLYAQIPGGLTPGPALIRLNSPNGDAIPAIAMQVDGPPPEILSPSAGGLALDATSLIRAGDSIVLTVRGLADPDGSVPAASAVKIRVGGIEHTAMSISPVAQQGVFLVQFLLSPSVPSGQQPVTVTVGTRQSAAINIGVRS